MEPKCCFQVYNVTTSTFMFVTKENLLAIESRRHLLNATLNVILIVPVNSGSRQTN